MSGSHLKNKIVRILEKYCRSRIFIIFKPTYYALAVRYIEKLTNLNVPNEIELVKTVFALYKKLVSQKSERLATSVGDELARFLQIDLALYHAYRESRIWSQRYIHGLGPFESQVYSKDENTIRTHIETDPVYLKYIQLKNQFELSKVVEIQIPQDVPSSLAMQA